MVQDSYERILGDIVGGGGHLGVNEGHVAIQLHAKLLHSGVGGALEGAVVQDSYERILGDIVGGGGHLGVNEGHVAVRSAVETAVFIALQVLL